MTIQAKLLSGYSIVVSTAHVPAQHTDMWPSPGPGPDTKCSKIVEVGCCSHAKS